MAERVIILGAGMAGLAAALTLGKRGFDVTVIERDPAPPDLSIDDVFARWERKGATQLRHSHVFLGRLCSILRQQHPALLAELKAAGAREIPFSETLPSPLRDHFDGDAADADMTFLFSRRTTLEYVMRRHTTTNGRARFLSATGATGLCFAEGHPLRVTGIRVRDEAGERTLECDTLIDATGRIGPVIDWLKAAGAPITEAESPAGILYYTRHYALHPGASEPERDKTAGAGDLGYLKYGVFPGDNGRFSVTLAVPEIETELRKIVVEPEIFDRICNALPGVRRWLEPERSTPVSKVFSMGNLANVWRNFSNDGVPHVLGWLPVGDAALRTNPLYGRGCTISFISAALLAGVMESTRDPASRLLAYEARLRAELHPFCVSMARQDAMAIRRARNERDPAHRPRLKARIIRHFAENAVVPATRGSLAVLRAFMRGFHMHEPPENFLKRPAILMRVLAMWARPKFLKRHLYPPFLGPCRTEMLALVGGRA